MRRISTLFLILIGVLLLNASFAQSSRFGRFEGKVMTEWEDDGRHMRLLADFRYFDPRGTDWLAPKGRRIDGASIPRVFWTFIGGPFEGKYRNASVVHDIACDDKARTWQSVHRMFYFASRTGGVGPLNAAIMYGAVYHFGPRWPGSKSSGLVVSSAYAQDLPPRTLTTDDDFLRMREYIVMEYRRLKGDISLEFVERLTSAFLKDKVPEISASARNLRGFVPEPAK